MLAMASPLTVHLVGQNALIPIAYPSSSAGTSTLIRSNAAFRFGENQISLLISKAVSIESRHNLDCLMVSPTARFRACP